MREALSRHWPEYLMEAGELGLFMMSACFFGTLLQHPGLPVYSQIPNPLLGRVLMGLAMGLTAIAIVYSSWGKRSGAHFNPSLTLTFFRLGKIKPWDAAFYVIAQFGGGIGGVLVASLFLEMELGHPSVNYVATLPGPGGRGPAFLAEVAISFLLMLTVLVVSNHSNLSRYTGVFAGVLVATYITFESPISGMSMNPARTFGSAFPAKIWTSLWVYFTAPLLGMLTAAEVYLRLRGAQGVICAKLHHRNGKRCIFRCGYMQPAADGGQQGAGSEQQSAFCGR